MKLVNEVFLTSWALIKYAKAKLNRISLLELSGIRPATTADRHFSKNRFLFLLMEDQNVEI